jgi:hypothetical protein
MCLGAIQVSPLEKRKTQVVERHRLGVSVTIAAYGGQGGFVGLNPGIPLLAEEEEAAQGVRELPRRRTGGRLAHRHEVLLLSGQPGQRLAVTTEVRWCMTDVQRYPVAVGRDHPVGCVRGTQVVTGQPVQSVLTVAIAVLQPGPFGGVHAEQVVHAEPVR